MLFDAEHDSASHYGDNKVALVDTLDYSAFGIVIGKMRIAFRLAYGLLDKVAGFINGAR